MIHPKESSKYNKEIGWVEVLITYESDRGCLALVCKYNKRYSSRWRLTKQFHLLWGKELDIKNMGSKYIQSTKYYNVAQSTAFKYFKTAINALKITDIIDTKNN